MSTEPCPPDAELERVLAGRSAGRAWEVHIAGCSTCQRRLETLRLGIQTLPAWLVDPETGAPLANALEQRTRLLSSPHPPAPPQPSAPPSVPPGGVEPPAASTPAPKPDEPAFFGRYQVLRALGTGGFGTVYLGHDSQLDRPVAIKVLQTGTGLPQASAEQFLQEARRLARLRHPGVVAAHDVGMHEGRVYLVSDFIDGPDLGQWLQTNRPGWAEAARIVAAVADALAHVHANLIVHRDIKTANIILTADRTPVLVDFGLALDESQAGSRSRGVVSGTPWYMSPEQATGTAHRIDGRTDIYSLGVVFYELLTGRVPFRATNVAELLRQLREDEPQPPRQLVPDIPPEVERICLKALAKQQQDRYSTAGDFADDLRRVLQTTSDLGGSQAGSAATSESEWRAAMQLTPWPGALSTRSSWNRTLEAERRQVTILVCGCDLFESATYLGLDTEDQAAVLQSIQRICEQTVRRCEGAVIQCNEEGLLACFGYPVAYENATHRAVLAGFSLLENLEAVGGHLLAGQSFDPGPWVGIHTGPAVVEAKDDAVSVMGEARNVAVRLRDVAVPGGIVCTEAAHQLFRGQVECTDIGPGQLRGVAQPVQLFRVERAVATGSPIHVLEDAALTPLTGRDLELSLLKQRWEQAQEGLGQVVLLVGEPGLGKSRLVHTLKEHVLGQMTDREVDGAVIEWRCAPHYQNTALYPAIDFYERALAFSREEPSRARFDRLLHHLEQYGLVRPDTVPLWAALMSLPNPDRFPSLALSPARQREETFRIMLEWLHTRAARKPVMFVVEDLHWADASTLEFLQQYLAEGLHDHILTVLTFRPEFQPPWPAPTQQTSLALNRLTRRQVGELMRKQAGEALSEAVVDQVYDRAGGVPLFVEEFTRMVQESGTRDPAQPGDAPSSAFPAHEIPATLQELVMARLERMEGGRELAQLAAVLGREFGYDLLSAVATSDDTALQAELTRLVRADILSQKGQPPRATYLFKHALLEDALYNSLVKGKRQQFHRRIGEVLEARFPQTVETKPELLAHHFSEAGDIEKAIAYSLQAGRRSRERSSLCEAIGHFTKGLALLNTLAESRARDDLELQFLTLLGPTYIEARGYAAPEVGPTLQRARELCERNGDPQQLFGIMLGMWEWRIVRADLRMCVDLAADGMALAERLGDPGMMMEALFMPAVTRYYRAEFEGARASHEAALARFEDRERTKFWTASTGHNGSVTHRCYLALDLWHLGYPDQALRVVREALELARSIGHPYSLGHAVDFTAYLNGYCRFGAEMQAAAEEEIALGTEQGFPLWHALGILHKGAGLVLQGWSDEGLPLLLKGYRAFRATGAQVRVPTYLGMLGEAYTRCGRFEEAHEVLTEALAVAEKNDDRSHEAELYRLTGELLWSESRDAGAAESSFHKAIEIARRQQSRAWELRGTMSLARLWQWLGRGDEARAALAAVYATFTEGFAMPDIADAAVLLRSLC